MNCAALADASNLIQSVFANSRAMVWGRAHPRGPLSTHHPKHLRRILLWRREWDSNPRGACTPAGFQDRCIQPLCHLSYTDEHRSLELNRFSCAIILGCPQPAHASSGCHIRKGRWHSTDPPSPPQCGAPVSRRSSVICHITEAGCPFDESAGPARLALRRSKSPGCPRRIGEAADFSAVAMPGPDSCNFAIALLA